MFVYSEIFTVELLQGIVTLSSLLAGRSAGAKRLCLSQALHHTRLKLGWLMTVMVMIIMLMLILVTLVMMDDGDGEGGDDNSGGDDDSIGGGDWY